MYILEHRFVDLQVIAIIVFGDAEAQQVPHMPAGL